MLGVAFALALLAGCRADARVEITMRSDGSGTLRATVTMDAAARNTLGGAAGLANSVPLDDLRRAGWKVSEWTTRPGGGAQITFEHDFSDQRDLATRLAELTGPQGILRSPQLTHHRSWFSSTEEVSMVVDLKAPSPGITHDAALSARLRAAGIDPAALEAQLGPQLALALHLTVIVHVPGHTTTYQAQNGSLTTLRVAHDTTDWNRMVKFGIALTLALLAGMFFLAAHMGVRRERRRHTRVLNARSERVPLM
ncbi:MAG TPA: hypothetical protein VN636_16280 [Acidimicrobiia bacterium]|nr:hypothetical protein [Acidimicrobiia bacterium]